MCGHVGIMGAFLAQRHKDAMSLLLYFDTLRGEDSTGVAAIRTNRDVKTYKTTVPGNEYIQHNRFKDLLTLNDVCWIGHNRYGTIGGKTRSNAHPFEIADEDGEVMLVGAHNGTLKNKHTLPNASKFGTDSEALYTLIEDVGVKDALAQAEGAWALVFWDFTDDTLNFIRNKERELFFAWEKGKKNVIWASEEWMIRVACSKARIDLEDGKVFSLEPDTLYKWEGPLKVTDEIGYTTEGGLVGKPPAFFQTQQATGGSTASQQFPRLPAPAHQGATAQTTTTGQSTESRNTLTTVGGSNLSPDTSTSSQTVTPDATKTTSTKPSSDAGSPSASHRPQLKLVGGGGNGGFRPLGFQGKPISAIKRDHVLDKGCAWCELVGLTVNDRFSWIDTDNVACGMCCNGSHSDSDSDTVGDVNASFMDDDIPWYLADDPMDALDDEISDDRYLRSVYPELYSKMKG